MVLPDVMDSCGKERKTKESRLLTVDGAYVKIDKTLELELRISSTRLGIDEVGSLGRAAFYLRGQGRTKKGVSRIWNYEIRPRRVTRQKRPVW
jgi:hypothetical protein